MSRLTAGDFLGSPITKDYLPSAYYSTWFLYRKAPPFNLRVLQEMLTDPRILFGLWLLKGPILSKSRFHVVADNKEIKSFLIDNVTRFWRNSAARALKAVEWGFSGSEVLYKVKGPTGQIYFDTLKDLRPLDCRAVTREGKLVGMSVHNLPGRTKKVSIPTPRFLWHVQGREINAWYGRSRCFGAYIPWLETWSDGGYRDSRRLFFHKYAYSGGTIYHPPGTTKLEDENGNTIQVVSNRDLAREIMEKKKTGGTVALPNTEGGAPGTRAWEITDPTIAPPPSHVMEYGADLKREIFEGMGIPPEIAHAEGTGAYAGRKVPEDAYYANLQEILNALISDADAQIFRLLVELNFGPNQEYEIVPAGLLTPTQEERSLPPPGWSRTPEEELQMGTLDEDPLVQGVFWRKTQDGKTKSSLGTLTRN